MDRTYSNLEFEGSTQFVVFWISSSPACFFSLSFLFHRFIFILIIDYGNGVSRG